jgi:hypothetical protein
MFDELLIFIICRKFLDPYRISNLISYLEKLNDKGLATKVSALSFNVHNRISFWM